MEARDRAIRYLNARMCSCAQMKDYLRRKGHEEEEIGPVIDELKEYNYLDDLKYARAFIQAGYEKGRGIGRIRRELAQKGVSPEIIAFAEEEIEDVPDEFEMALEIGKSILEPLDTDGLEWKEREALKGRVARRLATRGFSTDVIYRVIGKLL